MAECVGTECGREMTRLFFFVAMGALRGIEVVLSPCPGAGEPAAGLRLMPGRLTLISVFAKLLPRRADDINS